MTQEAHEALGLFFHGTRRIYPGSPNYVWLNDLVDDATHVRVRYTDGAEILYPLSAFDFIVMATPK